MEDLSDEEGVEAIEEAGVDITEDDSTEVSTIQILNTSRIGLCLRETN
jgi:H2-forming N5,N10-methylenetetrahydromethanopterin dehydrogenase-like enzyme